MKYGQFIKALKDKGVKVEDRTRHLKLSYGGKQTGCKRHPAEGYPLMLLGKLCKIRNFSQSPFGGFISEESDGNFPSGRN